MPFFRSAAAAPDTPAMSSVAYPPLKPGDTVAVVAPAGPASADLVARVPALLQARGWRTRLYPSCHAQRGFLAGDDALRAADLHSAFADPEVRLVWCLRGGYGSARLLPLLDLPRIQQGHKLLVGYSDITALHTVLADRGVPSLHAPMPASDLLLPGRESDADLLFSAWAAGLKRGHPWRPTTAPRLRVPGIARGRLLGGNLAVLASLLGTPWQPRAEGTLLFLEDVNEEAYRVDRLLVQLKHAGVLAAASGFVLGGFTGADDATEVLAEHLLPLNKPLWSDWPAGHCSPHWPVPIGAQVELDADTGCLTLLQDLIA